MELSKDILGGRKMEDRVLDWAVYEKTAREMAAEGLVLLKNDNKALPLKQGETVSVFGRMQNHYYKSGTGSGIFAPMKMNSQPYFFCWRLTIFCIIS